MTKTLLIYGKVTALDVEKHKNLSIQHEGDFSFARDINASQILATEFSKAAAEFPIIFAGKKGEMFPSVLMGVETDKNLMVGKDGTWQADYIPAFLRRYPFLFSLNEEAEQFTLCYDADFAGFNTDDNGAALFEKDGSQSKYLQQAISFTQSYHAEFEATKKLTQEIDSLGLFVPARANMNIDGTQTALAGFKTVEREKLAKLPAAKIKALVKSGAMELIYTHLYSLKNMDGLAKRSAESRP